FTIVVRGRAAHAGRDFEQGRNAVVALADFITQADALNGQIPGVTINIGRMTGGGPANVVPDLALARINVRTLARDDEPRIIERLDALVEELNRRDGISAELHQSPSAPPKELDDRSRRLLEQIIACGRD